MGLDYWNASLGDGQEPTPHDFEQWRTELRSFASLAAAGRRGEHRWKNRPRNIARGAQITASAFSVVGIQPLMGRLLVEEDQVKGATPVVLIGHDLWQKYFQRTIVGIMP